MDALLQSITDWIHDLLYAGITDNLNNTFDTLNYQVGEVANQVSRTPASFEPGVFAMIRTISENVVMPIAGIILTFIACYELISLVVSHNNLANFESWIFFKWIFKTFVAVELITHTFDITMAVFDVAQHVVNGAAGVINGSTAIDQSQIQAFYHRIDAMEIGPMFSLYLQTFVVQFLMLLLSAIIFVIVYARMIEIYLTVSLAPIPMATFGNKEQSMIGQNYLRSLFALGFQGLLLMICIGIYAVLIHGLTAAADISGTLWKIMGYTILLAFTLFKTGAIAKSVFHAH